MNFRVGFYFMSTNPEAQSHWKSPVLAPVPAQNSCLRVSLTVSGSEMTFYRLLSAVLLPTLWLFVTAAEDGTKPATRNTAAPRPTVTNSTHGVNSTQSNGKSHEGGGPGLNVDSSMIQRALYVLIGITMIGVLYFLIRAVR